MLTALPQLGPDNPAVSVGVANLSTRHYPAALILSGWGGVSTEAGFILGGQYRELRFIAGLTDDSDTDATVHFEILLDGLAAYSGDLKFGIAQQINLNTTGAENVSLVAYAESLTRARLAVVDGVAVP